MIPSLVVFASGSGGAALAGDWRPVGVSTGSGKPVGMDEWEVLAGALRKPSGSLRCAARRSTEPAGCQLGGLGMERETGKEVDCLPGTSIVLGSLRTPILHFGILVFSSSVASALSDLFLFPKTPPKRLFHVRTPAILKWPTGYLPSQERQGQGTLFAVALVDYNGKLCGCCCRAREKKQRKDEREGSG